VDPPSLSGDHEEQPRYHSFLVRIWCGSGGWQGEVRTLQSGDHRLFVGVQQLLFLLQSTLEAEDPAGSSS
jgi:hypothetical protein